VSRSRREIKRIMYLAQPYGLPRPRPSNGRAPVEEADALPGPVDVVA
jgi:hypothetical protein